MKKKSFFFLMVILCLLIGGATAFYWYQKPRTGLKNIKPEYSLNANQLYASFASDEAKANKEYVGKVLQVKGTVDDVLRTDSTTSILLQTGEAMGGINCSLAPGNSSIPVKGNTVSIKGRCVGYLADVNIVDALVVQ